MVDQSAGYHLMIEQLIQNFSPEALQQYFLLSHSSFRPDNELLLHINLDDQPFELLQKVGEFELSNSDEMVVFTCLVTRELSQRSSKKKQYDLAKKVMRDDQKDGALFVFYDQNGAFRFSFIRRFYGESERQYTPWKRYTYFVDPDLKNQTFRQRIGQCDFSSLESVQKAFSVEPLSKQFYSDLSHWYYWALGKVEFPNDKNEDRSNLHAQSLIRLITRVMFVWFMKQKKLIPGALFDLEDLNKLLTYQDKTGSTFYKAILQNLFFATLNTPRHKGRKFVHRQSGVQGFYRYRRFIQDEERFLSLMDQIPFLNGGLFDNLDQVSANAQIRVDCFSDRRDNEERLKVPDELFFGQHEHVNLENTLGSAHRNVAVSGLIDLLQQYNFTIDENTPHDQEVALDPELLGLVFENLLASYNPETQETARNESGSFYTPRSIVDFMVEKSLVEHIAQHTGLDKNLLLLLFSSSDEQPFGQAEDRSAIVETLSKVQILDPACGSGAFPMGALQKMVHALGKLDPDNRIWHERQKERALEETRKAFELGDRSERQKRLDAIEKAFAENTSDPDYARKLFLIEHALFGADIQPIAL